jgi:ABC-type Zn uptake system ZnuABC Zn-binding protein ZnuA
VIRKGALFTMKTDRMETWVLTRRRALAGAGAIAAVGLLGTHTGTRAQDATPAPTSSLGWTDELSDNGQLNVATTVAPISSIVRNVAGPRINLRGIVPDGVNSHTFEPAPSDAVTLTAADLLIMNGLFLEEPTLELAESTMPEGSEILKLADLTITEDEWAFDFSFPEEGGNPNPHLWINVPYALNYAVLSQEKLAELLPEHADYFAENLTRYSDVLNRLDAAIMEAVQTVPEQNRKLLTYHDSYAYFARRYGMTVIGAVQPSDFSEPSAAEVADLIDQIREFEIPAVFGSEVFPSDVLEQIASETGAVFIDQLRDDAPPGEPGSPEHTYVGMMLKNMSLMIPALGGTIEAFEGIEPYDTFLP